MLMKFCSRASPKHRYSMIEVDYGGGGTAHGWERSIDQLVCLGVPLLPYIKEQGGGRPALAGRARRGKGRRRGRRKEREERGPAP